MMLSFFSSVIMNKSTCDQTAHIPVLFDVTECPAMLARKVTLF